MTTGATATSIQEYMAAAVLHQDSPMDITITTGATTARAFQVPPFRGDRY